MGYAGVDFWLALSFLTAVPTPSFDYEKANLGRSGVWFTVVGLLLGGILLGAEFVLGSIFPSWATAVLIVFVWALLTGGLHLDGLADCFDGFLAPVPKERRLEIMKDPRLGTFGAIGLLMTLLLKVALVADLRPSAFGLLLAPVVARWMILFVTRWPLATERGMGSAFAKDVSKSTIVVAGLIPLLLGAWLGWQALLAILGAILIMMACSFWATRAIGGVTGDLFGLVVEWSETAVLLVLVMRI